MGLIRLLAIGVVFLAFWPYPRIVQAAQTGEILAYRLNLRAGPGLEYPVLKRLHKGNRVTIQSKQMGWLQITHANTHGFILDDKKLVLISPDQLGPATVPDEKKIKELHRQAETIHKQLRASKSELDTMAAEEEKVLAEFAELDQKLNRTRSQVRSTQTALATIRDQIDRLQDQYAELEGRVQARESYAAQRLVALYKLNWLGRMPVLASANSFFDFIQRKSALERILDQDKRLLDELRNGQSELEALIERLNSSKIQKQALELVLQQEETELSTRQQQRSAILERIRNEKSLQLAALSALEQAARQLDGTLEKQLSAAPVSDSVTRPAEIKETISFETHKGLLSWPVQGKIISFFGTQSSGKFNVATFQSGINIQAERGEPIKAVAAGDTIFSSWFNGFGNTIIIDHGRHYYTVYAHLEEAFKVKGDRVEKNEVIATVGDSGSLLGPALHFEVRYHGKPADPLLWIKNG